jgi:hypothetical protein
VAPNFPYLLKTKNSHIQEAKQTSGRRYMKKNLPEFTKNLPKLHETLSHEDQEQGNMSPLTIPL